MQDQGEQKSPDISCNCGVENDTICSYCLGHASSYATCLSRKREFAGSHLANAVLEKIAEVEKIKDEVNFDKGWEQGEKTFYSQAPEENESLPKEEQLTFPLSDLEFGEIFHIGGALSVSKNHEVNLSACSQGQFLFLLNLKTHSHLSYDEYQARKYSLLGKKEKEDFKLKQTIHLKASTNIIAKFFLNHTGNPEEAIFDSFTFHLQNAIPNLSDKCTQFIVNQGIPRASLNYSSSLIFSNKDIISCSIESTEEVEKYPPQAFFASSSRPQVSSGSPVRTAPNRALVFVRRKNDETKWRNLRPMMLKQIVGELNKRKVDVILVGDKLEDEEVSSLRERVADIKIYNMTNFHESKSFSNLMSINPIAGQIYLYRTLQKEFGVKFGVGMKSGALDGLAFTGIPIIFFTDGCQRMTEASKYIKFLKPIQYDEDVMKKNHSSKRDFPFHPRVIGKLNSEIDNILVDFTEDLPLKLHS